jgi:hypothetical protein
MNNRYEEDIRIAPRDPVDLLRRRLLALLEAATREGLDARVVHRELVAAVLILQTAIELTDARERGDQ